jgi:hypothetical protein
MNAFVDKLLDDDFIWSAITSHLPGGRNRSSNTNYLNFNCPMCTTVGESADTKKRGGIKRSSEGIGYNCFNCSFKARYKAGDKLSRKMQMLLKELGHGELEVSRLAHRAFQLSRVIADSNTEVVHRDNRFTPAFKERLLPPDTFPLLEWAELGCDDPNFLKVAEYALSRGGGLSETVMWCPDAQWRDRMILPFKFRGTNVGWTGRLVGEATEDNPKYMSEVPTDYLYNSDVMMNRDRQYILMPEGVLDAYAIDGVSPLGAKLSPRQASWIKESGKTVIVIPDRDKSGQRLIDAALQHNWRVSFPRISRGGNNWWEADCKDCSDAVKRYGRLYTIRSIIETSTDKPLEINVKRKWLVE